MCIYIHTHIYICVCVHSLNILIYCIILHILYYVLDTYRHTNRILLDRNVTGNSFEHCNPHVRHSESKTVT
jgi:hypothetical protein